MNCKEYCRYSRYCKAKGEEDTNEFECPNYWYWDDIYLEAEREKEYEMEDRYREDDYEEDEEKAE
jgi:hypothetical protein